MAERPKLNIIFKNYRNFSPDQILNQAKRVEEESARYDEMTRPVDGKIELEVRNTDPILLHPISDTHLFAPETDNQKVKEILEKLDDKNTYGVICGDFVEGVNIHISDHTGRLNFTFGEQLWMAKEIIRPYVESGKILGIVGWYNGHDGSWAENQATIEAVRFLKDGLFQPDGSPLQAVYNGGVLKIHLTNGDDFILKTFHDAGAGGSDDINPLGSLRNAAWSEKLNSPDRVDGVVAGHQHHRAATAKEITYDKLSGKEFGQVLLALGTTKGNDAKHADKYLIAQAKGPTKPPGGGIILHQGKENTASNNNIWAYYGYEKGGVLYDAAKLWDKAEKQKLTGELLEKIIKKEGSPTIDFDKANSRTRTKEDESKIPLYENFRWKIKDGNLPILVYLLANIRKGSASGDRDSEKYMEIVNQVTKDPYKYLLIMRNMIDADQSADFERKATLDEVANDLRGAKESGSLLGFMLDKNLRTDRWNKQVLGTPYRVRYQDKYGHFYYKWERDRKDGFYPGDYLYKYSAIARTPLYLNESLMFLNLNGKQEYTFQLLDHLSWSGSEFDMYRGLVQAQRKGRVAVDVVVGGNMPGTGVMTTPDGVFIAPGWFSDYNSRNKANIKRAPLGGQGVILFPDKHIVIPAATQIEATDTHASVLLNAGLSPRDKGKLMDKRTR